MKHLKYFESNGTGWRQFNDLDEFLSFGQEMQAIKPFDDEVKRLDEWLESRNWTKDFRMEKIFEYTNRLDKLYISKREDEWWILIDSGSKGDFYFACDELDGLINCLQETGLVTE